jgi:DNA-binding Lrp family transcriptional regulator
MKDLDDFDIKIINILRQDGRISNEKLAKQLSLSEAP